MKNVTNVEFILLVPTPNGDVKQETSYFDLMNQAIKTPGSDGLGDLEEQILRMTVFNKVKACIEDEAEYVELEDAEAKMLVKCQKNVKYAILDDNLIAYQTLIKGL